MFLLCFHQVCFLFTILFLLLVSVQLALPGLLFYSIFLSFSASISGFHLVVSAPLVFYSQISFCYQILTLVFLPVVFVFFAFGSTFVKPRHCMKSEIMTWSILTVPPATSYFTADYFSSFSSCLLPESHWVNSHLFILKTHVTPFFHYSCFLPISFTFMLWQTVNTKL